MIAPTKPRLGVDAEIIDILLTSCVFDTDWEGLKERLSKEFTVVILP